MTQECGSEPGDTTVVTTQRVGAACAPRVPGRDPAAQGSLGLVGILGKIWAEPPLKIL